MAEDLHIAYGSKEEKYRSLLPQIQGLLSGEKDLTANLAIVPDVEKFPGHIACSSLSRSEIVVPLIYEGKIWGVLDVDSAELDQFNVTDQQYLEQVVGFLNASIE